VVQVIGEATRSEADSEKRSLALTDDSIGLSGRRNPERTNDSLAGYQGVNCHENVSCRGASMKALDCADPWYIFRTMELGDEACSVLKANL
jgi:hypothetical protein